MYAVDNIVYAASGRLFISTDGGHTWVKRTWSNGLASNNVLGVFAVGSTVYAAAYGGLSISTDGGSTFMTKTLADGYGSNWVNGVYTVGSTVYVPTGGGLFLSTDGGNTFVNKTPADGLGDYWVNGAYADGNIVFAATRGGLSISTDDGNTFTNKTTANGLGSNDVNRVYAVGSTVYAATDSGLSISTDGGNHFVNKTTANGLGSSEIHGVSAVGSTVYAATSGGLSISTDGGTHFVNKPTVKGLGSNYVLGVFAVGSTVYAATDGGLSIGVCTPSPISVENENYHLQYDGWRGVADSRASGGTYRLSHTPGDTVAFTFGGTSVQWVTVKGPDMGIAKVSLDGVAKKDQDLYNPTPLFKFVRTFGGLASARHTLVVRVSGNKNASASDSNVAVDAFVVGTTTTQENRYGVQYGQWKGGANTAASGGSYRVSRAAGSVITFKFTGDSVEWLTARGPAYGRAEVWIDGVSKGGYDLYQASQQWRVVIPFTSLGAGAHTLEIHVLGTKNTASKGLGVVVDAFRGPITPE